MIIAVGSDHAGFALKVKVVAHLSGAGHKVLDVGADSGEDTDYPIYAHRVGRKVAEGEAEKLNKLFPNH